MKKSKAPIKKISSKKKNKPVNKKPKVCSSKVSKNKPTYILATTDRKIDKAMQKFAEFAAKVSAFGECDGFAEITVSQGPHWEGCSLSRGWELFPPEHYILINLDGSEVEMIKHLNDLDAERDRRYAAFDKLSPTQLKNAIKNQDPLVTDLDLFDDNIYFIVNCHAGGVSMNAAYRVPHGFTTRIVSQSLDLAIEKTFKLWEEEHKKPDSEKYRSLPRNYHKDLSYAIEQMHDKNSIEDVLKTLTDSFWGKDTLAAMDSFQAWSIVKFVWELEKDIQKLYKLLKKEFSSTVFKKHYDELENLDKLFDRKNKGKTVAFERIKDLWAERDKLTKKFYKKIGHNEA